MNLTVGKILLFLTFLLFIGGALTDYFNHTYIKIEFKNMDPLPARMGVFYKGYKLGSTNKVRISKDFKTTYLYVTLNQRGLQLPKNITAEIKNYNEDIRYVDIIYPAAPMIKYIKNGDIIQGSSTVKFSNISDINQAHLDDLSEKGENLLAAATKTTESLTEFLELLIDILNENRENLLTSSTCLKNSMTYLENSTKNFNDLSEKLNAEITRQTIRNSAQNVEKMTFNFATSSNELVTISGNFNKTSSDFSVLIPKLSVLIDTAQIVMCNINEIIVGVKETLKKKFSGARLIFGKAISK